jgi:hypothetical protein
MQREQYVANVRLGQGAAVAWEPDPFRGGDVSPDGFGSSPSRAAMRFFGTPSRHSRKTSVISTIVTSRYIRGLLPRAEARAGDVYLAVRRG